MPHFPRLRLFLDSWQQCWSFASSQRSIRIKIRFPLKDICCPRIITQADTKEEPCVWSGWQRYYFSLQRKETRAGLYCEACFCGRRSLRWLNVEACRAVRMVYIPGKCLSAVECSHGEVHIWTRIKQDPYNNTQRKTCCMFKVCVSQCVCQTARRRSCVVWKASKD